MMLDIADQVVAGVVALVSCLCHWQDRSRVGCDGPALLFLWGFTLTFLIYDHHIAPATG